MAPDRHSPSGTAAAPPNRLQLHEPRALVELRRTARPILAALLPESAFAVLIDDDVDRQTVELVCGDGWPFAEGQRVRAADWSARAADAMPLRYGAHEIGRLLFREPPPAATDELVETLDHYAVALVNLKLNAAAEAAVDHYCASLQAFQEGVVLFRERDPQVTGACFLQLFAQALGAHAAALLTYAEIGNPQSPLRLEQVLGMPETMVDGLFTESGESWPEWAARRPLELYPRDENGRFTNLVAESAPPMLRSIAACPLVYDNIAAGVVLAFNVADDDRRRLDDSRGLSELGAALFHRIQLERQAVLAKAMQTELQIAAKVQSRLQPTAPPRSPHAECAWHSQPSSNVGGDYVDVIDDHGDTTVIAIADVSGHGVNSALLMTSFRSHFRAAVRGTDPGTVFANLNGEVLNEVGSTGMFITAAALRLAADGRSLHWSSAGHNEMLLRRAADGEIVHLESSGPPLGMFPGGDYVTETTPVAPGDLLLVYTDGVTEAAKPGRDEVMFGTERLAAIMAAHGAAGAEAVRDRVVVELRAFVGGTEAFADDVSLVVLRVA